MAWQSAQSDWQGFLGFARVSLPLTELDAIHWQEAPKKPDFIRELAWRADLTLREAEEVIDLRLLPTFQARIEAEGAIAA